MHVSVRRVVSAVAFLLIASLAPPDLFAQSCGVERWSVKTGTAADVGKTNLPSSSSNTIATMRGWPAPNPIPSNNRVSPYETTVWVLNATLTQYKLASDSDYHLVLSDPSGNTLLSKITSAHNSFNAKCTPTGGLQTANMPVQTSGAGMFDLQPDQTGVAPN